MITMYGLDIGSWKTVHLNSLSLYFWHRQLADNQTVVFVNFRAGKWNKYTNSELTKTQIWVYSVYKFPKEEKLLFLLEGMARYASQLLAPAEGFRLLCCFFFFPFLVFSSDLSKL